MNKIIGISGVAGAGKDTFCDLLSEHVKCEKFALAESLKKEVSSWCLENYAINPTNCSRDEKNVIRPFLVFHGMQKRAISKGRHWIEQLNKKINNYTGDSIIIITDIRYDDYHNDEVHWLKEELNGVLVHVSQYKNVPSGSNWDIIREYRKGINEEEERNEPFLKEKANFRIEWEYQKNGQIKLLEPKIIKFLKWYENGNHEREGDGQLVS